MRKVNLVFATAAVGLLAACPPKLEGTAPTPVTPTASEAPKEGTMLAKVGGTVITVEEFEDKINKQSPFIRSRFADLEKRREYLDNQVRFELLAEEAMRRGIQNEPDVRESLKKIMVQKLTREEFDNRVKLEDITDQEIQGYYDTHGEDYHKPEMVRVAHILVPFGADKAAAQKQAQTVLRELKKRKDDRMAFRELAKEHSGDEETKNSGGDLRYLSKDEYAEQFGPTVAEAVFKLEKLNDLSDVVEGKAGLHIFKQTGRRQAIDRTLEQVRTQIRNRLYRDKRTEAFNKFVDELRTKSGVTIDEERLAALNIVGAAQPVAGPPGAPQPPGGAMPPTVPIKPAGGMAAGEGDGLAAAPEGEGPGATP